MHKTDLYINGAWQQSSDGQRFDVINPADETVIASVASATVADAQAALDAAAAAFAGWAGRTPRQRSEVLRNAFDLMTARLEEFAHLITLENGKARADAMGEAAYAAEFFRWFAEEAVRADGTITHAPASGARIIVQHKPAGIAVLITPWNYPAAMGTRKIAPALAAGCPVIIKPASETPLTMLALMPLLEEAGVPKGVVNVLPSRRTGAIVDAMLHDPRVRVVSFTGSTEVGRTLLRSAADQVLKPAMELGGNAPLIVFEDADLDVAVDGAMLANYWQGLFPIANQLLDGWERTSPVRSFPGNGYDLFDMIGNVWEWTRDAARVGDRGGEEEGAGAQGAGEPLVAGAAEEELDRVSRSLLSQ